MKRLLSVLFPAGLGLCLGPWIFSGSPQEAAPTDTPRGKSAVFMVGDGMGVSTVSAARIFSVGVSGQLALDRMPYTAASRTYSADHLTADSASTMNAMVTGVKNNSGVLGFGPECERGDFQKNGDGEPLATVLEMAKQAGKKVGLVTTATITHATPAACYAKINERGREADIALQLFPDEDGNPELIDGIDVLFGGGRAYFVPGGEMDEEGVMGRRGDGRDLRQEFQDLGYQYCWNREGFEALQPGGKVLGLFEASHMEYEHDRATDTGGEPSLEEMTRKALALLADAPEGFLLIVEGGRIDHAHHEGNAYRAMVDTEEFDQSLAAVLETVDLAETLVLATADHSHVFSIGGYPMRPGSQLRYALKGADEEFSDSERDLLMGPVVSLDPYRGRAAVSKDRSGQPYTALSYGNGPGHRGLIADAEKPFPGRGGVAVEGPLDPNYRQHAAIGMVAETHGGEDVMFYSAGCGAQAVHGTVENSFAYEVITKTLGL